MTPVPPRAADRSSWSWMVARGVLTLMFGLALIWAGAAFLSPALLFGAFAFVEGVAQIVGGFSPRWGGVRWPLILSGVPGIIVGTMTFLKPGIVAPALL